MLIVFVVEVRFMKVFTVSLFGHRDVSDLRQLDERLYKVIKALIKKKSYVSFLIGRNGEFDEYAASVIKRVQKEFGKENNDVNLVLPYSVTKIEYYEKYYDSIIIPEAVYGAHPKLAITLKNRFMIEQSDLVIVYVERDKGGAYMALQYAKKLNKDIINLCKNDFFD